MRLSVPKSASFVGAEWDDCFSAPVVGFEECVNRHWHVSPPVWIADVDCVVCGDVDISFEGRAGLFVLLVFCNLSQAAVAVGWIRFLTFKFKKLCACFFCNELCDD